MEELKNNISQCSRKALINFNNNAASCYDRIISNIANLIVQKKELHYNVTVVHATILADAKPKLKSALGISEDFTNIAKPS
eukprot:15363668-Ditylum_brightwellii.AAC.1